MNADETQSARTKAAQAAKSATVARVAARHRRRRRLGLRQPRNILLLTALWLVLVGQVTIVSVVGGLLLSWLVTLLFPLPRMGYRGRPHLVGVVKLGVLLVWDLATASFRLAVSAFAREQPPSGIVRVDLMSDSDLYQANTGELMSVVPGSIVVDARRSTRRLYLHVFDMTSPRAKEEIVDVTLQVEGRVLGAFASSKEQAKAHEKLADYRRRAREEASS